ncbi:MAG: tautomerase family protein, partial [Hyphomicrobiales bacterium]|nr:tautomerase family protein [Hyphomicrobiales bacterium]
MPVITITLIEGYDEATRRRLSESLTDAARSVIAAPLDGVTVLVNEVAPANYMRGRQSRTPGPPLPAPQEVVEAFLKAMQARDLQAARKFLSDDFIMTFPGDVSFTRLEQLVDWAKTRYRSIAKTYERF